MNIIAIDDESAALRELERALNKIVEDANINLFTSAIKALEYAQENIVDVAFVDIQMYEMHGLILAKKLKDIHKSVNIIFVTAHSDYALGAFNMHASGYLLKPIQAEQISIELDNLRNPIQQSEKGIRVQCFGNFEIFVNGVPVEFGRARSKELLAFLVDRRGANVSRKEMAVILWEDEMYTRSKQTQLQVYLTEMTRSLEKAGGGSIILKKRGFYAVDISKFTCDYYDYWNGDAASVNRYHGEYMSNYSWAEFTAGYLMRNK
ncbi:response regulator [Lachnospiraceae bacterium OttesenSCG-928-D06]|nr:response regulator [Lachnospiraceae bacterium OttesenSCG-928-D06]